MIDFSHKPTKFTDDSKRPPMKAMVTMLVVLLVVIWLIFKVISFNIFGDYEICAFILLITAPIGYLFYTRIKDWLIKVLHPRTKYDAPILFGLVFSMAAIYGILSLNSYNVTSPKETVTITITTKYNKPMKGSKPHRPKYKYYIDFPRPDTVHLPFLITNEETVEISEETYEKIVPHKSQITLIYRKGNLGIPYWTKQTFTNLD